MAGSITDADREFVETWEHISPQVWGVIRFDPRGDERHEMIAGKRTFKITTEERIITEDRIRDELNDPFKNGSFRPVVVPDSVTIESNPNALSDEEIAKIFASSDIAWGENLKVIDSVATYRRMLELAETSEITIKRYRELESRLDEVRGQVRIDTKDEALKNFLNDRSTTRPEPEKRSNRQGGRSSSYR